MSRVIWQAWAFSLVVVALASCAETVGRSDELGVDESSDVVPGHPDNPDSGAPNPSDSGPDDVDPGDSGPDDGDPGEPDASPDAAPDVPSADYWLHWTGNDYTAPHTMTPGEIKSDFRDKDSWSRTQDRVRVVRDPAGDTGRGNVMAVFHPGSVGAGNGSIYWRSYLPEGWDEIYIAFDVYFLSTYDWRAGFKMGWGVVANLPCSSVRPRSLDEKGKVIGDGINCSTSKMMVYGPVAYGWIPPEGTLGSYTYYYSKGQKTHMLDDGPVPPYDQPKTSDAPNIFRIPKGRWFTIEKHVKMNDADDDESYDPAVDKGNGVDEVWIDGVLKLQRTNITWRIVNSLQFTRSTFSLYYGGPDEYDWWCPRGQDLYFDNIRISKKPITH